MKLTTLADKALLVKLTVRKANLTRRDTTAEAFVQTQLDDASLVVNRKLFRDKLNPINKLMADASEVYTYHKAHTLGYIDKGPRILANAEYFDYTQKMRELIGNVDRKLAELMPNYDKFVQLDMLFRSQGRNSTNVSVDDYPTANEFQSRMGFELRFQPLPEAKHFLFDISDEDMESFNQTMADVAASARSEVIKKMLEPLQHLVEKLNKPIGTDNSIFRDSAVENVIEGLEMAKRLNVGGDEDIVMMADVISQAMRPYADNKAVLRESPIVREQAAKKLDDIARQMGAFYGTP